MNAELRVRAVRSRFDEQGPEAFVITDPTNVAYLTGFEGVFDGEDAHALVITPEDVVLYTDTRYGEAASRAAEGTPVLVQVVRQDLYITLCRDLAEHGISSIGLESSVPHGRFRFISREFAGNVVVLDQLVEEVRQVKEPEELARIERAQALADAAIERAMELIRAGVTESVVALELEFWMRREGSDGVPFAPIVASGPNAALPHARVTDRRIERGDPVVIDLGARIGGYCSDVTRTVFVGPASERLKEVYEVVLAANRAGIESVRAGISGAAIDAAARGVIEQAGFGDLFGHGVGHGVGLEVHELPSISPRGAKSVRERSCLTIEPGVYVPGVGGVRIEDLVVVGPDGAQVLSRSTKDLVEL